MNDEPDFLSHESSVEKSGHGEEKSEAPETESTGSSTEEDTSSSESLAPSPAYSFDIPKIMIPNTTIVYV